MYNDMLTYSKSINEENDCAIIALSAVTHTSYAIIHKKFQELGRETGNTVPFKNIKIVIESMGFKLERINPYSFIHSYPRSYNPKHITPNQIDKFNHLWKDNDYLCLCTGHIFTVLHGDIIDWTKGRKHHIKYIFRVRH